MTGSWLELSVVSEPEAADAVAEVFGRWGRGVAIDQPVRQSPDGDGGWVDATQNVVVKTYLPVDEEAEERRRLLEEAAWHLGRLRHVEPLQTRVLAEEDWAHAWKKFFHPHRVGKHIVIVPSWRRRARQPDDVVIRLDPGMAFGTGLHPTTRMCLALIEEHVRSGDSMLVAEENARRNKVLRKVRIGQRTVEPGDPVEGAPFDLVAANISAFVLKNARDGLFSALKPGRLAILSGVLATAADDVRAEYEGGGWQHVETRQEGDWVAIVVRRP
jgi:ribosomal protein L11 methyltransferase